MDERKWSSERDGDRFYVEVRDHDVASGVDWASDRPEGGTHGHEEFLRDMSSWLDRYFTPEAAAAVRAAIARAQASRAG